MSIKSALGVGALTLAMLAGAVAIGTPAGAVTYTASAIGTLGTGVCW